MSVRSLTNRTAARIGASTVALAVVIAMTALPAQAGTPPTITSVTPTSGSVGTGVTINGSDLGGATFVRFNGTAATFFVNGIGTQITTSVPNGAGSGPLTVQTPNGTASNPFTVTGGSPNLTNFTPRSGPVGNGVTITGNTLGAVNSVRFNGVAAAFTVNSPNQISTTVPAGATTGRISVSNAFGTDVSQGNFAVTGTGAPVITGFNPHSGPAGTQVSIFGSNFTGTTAVRFNGTAANFTIVNNGKLIATVPGGATSGKISVTNAIGTTVTQGTFTVAGPKINSFTPATGPAGTVVTLFGNNFTGVNAVRFNGTAASFSFVNDSRVTTTVPGGATTGSITLTTPLGTATTTTFTVTASNHGRTVSLALRERGRNHLTVSGRVSVNDGYAACQRFVPVVIKRLLRGQWRWVTTTSTKQDGEYRAAILDRSGRYRATAKKIELVNGVTCGGDRSNVVRHHA